MDRMRKNENILERFEQKNHFETFSKVPLDDDHRSTIQVKDGGYDEVEVVSIFPSSKRRS